MRAAVAGILLVLLTVTPEANGQSERDTVDVLIPVEAVSSTLAPQSARASATGWELITVPVDESVEQTIEMLESETGARVYADMSYPLLDGSGEPRFSEQWSLENTGQEGGTPDADIDVKGAWPKATGEGVVVAVIDSGVDSGNSELTDQIWKNSGEQADGGDNDGNGFVDDVSGWDFVDNDNDPRPAGTTSDEAHGTFVAGIIAAGVNDSGISGIAPGARIMSLRACHRGDCMMSRAVEAIHYGVDSGADIINLSFGGEADGVDMGHPLAQAIAHARDHDVLVVTAAGNTPPDIVSPGSVILPAEYPHENNIAVAATDRNDRIGATSYYGPNIDIAAPGTDILSTSLSSYSRGTGTSFSAPHVAGVAALVKSLSERIDYRETVARLREGADSPSGVAGKVAWGRLNAANATAVFLDITGNIFQGDVEWAAETGVTRGCNPPTNTMFCPGDAVTRGQMAAFLNRHLGLTGAAGDHFEDDDGSTFEDDINAMAHAEITKGCNPPANDRYCPDDPVTREQMAAFIVRAKGLSANSHAGFDDVLSANTFVNDIGKLATAGITRGCNPPANTRFCPKDDVTRGQMAAFLHRAED